MVHIPEKIKRPFFKGNFIVWFFSLKTKIFFKGKEKKHNLTNGKICSDNGQVFFFLRMYFILKHKCRYFADWKVFTIVSSKDKHFRSIKKLHISQHLLKKKNRVVSRS